MWPCKTQKNWYQILYCEKGSRMLDIRRAVISALPKNLILDLEDRLRAEAASAHHVVQREMSLNAKRSREVEGQIRFRLQEQGYEEVVELHGGRLLTDGVMLNTNLKIFQPFARFSGPQTGVIIGFAAMPEPRTIPVKNRSRVAGVTLNVGLQPSLFADDARPTPSDIFVLFLTARDRERAGLIEEIAIGVIGSDYKDFIFYESLDTFLSGYGFEPAAPDDPDGADSDAKVVTLRKTRKLFVPPEKRPEQDAESGSEN